MRIRQIKPEFWKDAKLAELSEGARLFYIGTWGLADDSGWLRWNVAEIGAELYPFIARKTREIRVNRHASALIGLKKLHIHECGHAQLPKMPAHQHLAGTTRRVMTVQNEHSRCLPEPNGPQIPVQRDKSDIPATPRDSPRLPAPVSIGSVRIGSVSKEGKKHVQLVDGKYEVTG